MRAGETVPGTPIELRHAAPCFLLLQVGALSRTARGTNSSRMGAADVTGGDPAQLADDIYLCSRSDSEPDRQVAAVLASLLCTVLLSCRPSAVSREHCNQRQRHQ